MLSKSQGCNLLEVNNSNSTQKQSKQLIDNIPKLYYLMILTATGPSTLINGILGKTTEPSGMA